MTDNSRTGRECWLAPLQRKRPVTSRRTNISCRPEADGPGCVYGTFANTTEGGVIPSDYLPAQLQNRSNYSPQLALHSTRLVSDASETRAVLWRCPRERAAESQGTVSNSAKYDDDRAIGPPSPPVSGCLSYSSIPFLIVLLGASRVNDAQLCR